MAEPLKVKKLENVIIVAKEGDAPLTLFAMVPAMQEHPGDDPMTQVAYANVGMLPGPLRTKVREFLRTAGAPDPDKAPPLPPMTPPPAFGGGGDLADH